MRHKALSHSFGILSLCVAGDKVGDYAWREGGREGGGREGGREGGEGGREGGRGEGGRKGEPLKVVVIHACYDWHMKQMLTVKAKTTYASIGIIMLGQHNTVLYRNL